MSTRTRLPQEQGPRTAETSFIEGRYTGHVLTGAEKLATREVAYEFSKMDYSKVEVRYISKERGGLGN